MNAAEILKKLMNGERTIESLTQPEDNAVVDLLEAVVEFGEEKLYQLLVEIESFER